MARICVHTLQSQNPVAAVIPFASKVFGESGRVASSSLSSPAQPAFPVPASSKSVSPCSTYSRAAVTLPSRCLSRGSQMSNSLPLSRTQIARITVVRQASSGRVGAEQSVAKSRESREILVQHLLVKEDQLPLLRFGDRFRGLCIGSSGGRCLWGSGSEVRTKKGNLTVKSSLSDSVGAIMDGITSNWNADPPTWNSSLISIGVIFAIAAPLLWIGLTPPGILSAYVLGSVIWRAYGGQGLVTVVLFYVIGTAATKLKLKEKQKEGIAEKRSGRRGPGSVWGSGSAGLLCALFTIFGVGGPDITPLWQLGYLASLCTKLSDTVSSEIGKAYGKTTYLVTTFSVVPRGTEGAVSLEGTIAGLVAALFLVVSSYVLNQVDSTGGVIALVASQVANLFESYLGATLQGRPGFEWLSNDLVNVANITVGASLAILGQKFLTGS